MSTLDTFRTALPGQVFAPGEAAYADAVKTFNLTQVHRPDAVVIVSSAADVAKAVRLARTSRVKIEVQGAAHGDRPAITEGVLLFTRGLRRITVDAAAKRVSFEPGVKWKEIVAAVAEHGLAAITGSSPEVGAVGYLLGGGLGPLARSHGFSSDYVERIEVVTGTGETLRVDASQHPDLFWALRGGKTGLGIVTEVTLRLLPMKTLYAGSLTYGPNDVERVFRAWLEWTKTAPADVSTSVMMGLTPPAPVIPKERHGQPMIGVRFAFPGSNEEGAKHAAFFRTVATPIDDQLGEMPVTDTGRIHNDPTEPTKVWIRGDMLDRVDGDFATVFLKHAAPNGLAKFDGVEVRHLGAATATDVPEGSAVGGRPAAFAIGYLGVNAERFERGYDEADAAFRADLQPWRSREVNINFHNPSGRADYARAWSPATWAKLETVRTQYDPDQVFASVYF